MGHVNTREAEDGGHCPAHLWPPWYINPSSHTATQAPHQTGSCQLLYFPLGCETSAALVSHIYFNYRHAVMKLKAWPKRKQTNWTPCTKLGSFKLRFSQWMKEWMRHEICLPQPGPLNLPRLLFFWSVNKRRTITAWWQNSTSVRFSNCSFLPQTPDHRPLVPQATPSQKIDSDGHQQVTADDQVKATTSEAFLRHFMLLFPLICHLSVHLWWYKCTYCMYNNLYQSPKTF